LVEALRPILKEHRLCGTPNGYDGCYAHFPMAHCRADGMAWPCDVDAIRRALAATDATAPDAEREE
jgi:hypothetical protein